MSQMNHSALTTVNIKWYTWKSHDIVQKLNISKIRTRMSQGNTMLTTRYGTKMVLSDGNCFSLSKIYIVLLDVINIRDNCPISGQIWLKNLAGASLGRICQKGLDALLAGAGAKVRYIPSCNCINLLFVWQIYQKIYRSPNCEFFNITDIQYAHLLAVGDVSISSNLSVDVTELFWQDVLPLELGRNGSLFVLWTLIMICFAILTVFSSYDLYTCQLF